MKRRDFLISSLVGFLGGLLARSRKTLADLDAPPRYRQLGRTGLMISEIGFGGYPVSDPQVVHYAIDRGINYIDTAYGYRHGASEMTIGRAIQHRRQEVVLATKWRPWAETTKAEMMASLNTSLQRLRTDYVDVIQVHQVGKASGGQGIERLTNPELMLAFAAAKQAGKARFLGVTGHDGDLMEIMDYAVDSGHFSTMLCRYSFLDYPEQNRLFVKAGEAGVGVVVMKTLGGAKGQDLSDFKDKHTSFKQAALKWVLSNPNISGLVISMARKEQVAEYLTASGGVLTHEDVALLAEYRARFANQVCRFCNQCESACPYSLPVADILRFSMYTNDYGEIERGRINYAELAPAKQAHLCVDCAAPCLAACEYGVEVRQEMMKAHATLAV